MSQQELMDLNDRIEGTKILVCPTLEDLRSGKRARVTEAECSQITGRGRYSLQRDRWKAKGMKFQKDENGRIWYPAAEVLAYLNGKKHRSTSEYDTSSLVERVAKARDVKENKASK